MGMPLYVIHMFDDIFMRTPFIVTPVRRIVCIFNHYYRNDPFYCSSNVKHEKKITVKMNRFHESQDREFIPIVIYSPCSE